MAPRIYIHQQVAKVEALAWQRLSRHVEGGTYGMLTDVRKLIRGLTYDRTERMPILAFFTGVATPEAEQQSAFMTKWELPLRFRAVIDSADPVEGPVLARDLAGRAMHAMLSDPDKSGVEAMSLTLIDHEGGAYDLNVGQFETTIAPPPGGVTVIESRSGVVAKFETSF